MTESLRRSIPVGGYYSYNLSELVNYIASENVFFLELFSKVNIYQSFSQFCLMAVIVFVIVKKGKWNLY